MIENAKVQRPSVCNALDTLLINSLVADELLPRVVSQLSGLGVKFRAEPRAMSVLQDDGSVSSKAEVTAAGPDDFDTERLSLVLGLKVVDNLDEAIEHIVTN